MRNLLKNISSTTGPITPRTAMIMIGGIVSIARPIFRLFCSGTPDNPVARRRAPDSRKPATVATYAPMPPTSTTSAVLHLRAAIRRAARAR